MHVHVLDWKAQGANFKLGTADEVLQACVQGLSKLIGDHAPSSVKTQKFENYFGRKIAVDASMSLYQFLVRFCFLKAPTSAWPVFAFTYRQNTTSTVLLQIVVGRVGDQLLSNEAGEITRYVLSCCSARL